MYVGLELNIERQQKLWWYKTYKIRIYYLKIIHKFRVIFSENVFAIYIYLYLISNFFLIHLECPYGYVKKIDRFLNGASMVFTQKYQSFHLKYNFLFLFFKIPQYWNFKNSRIQKWEFRVPLRDTVIWMKISKIQLESSWKAV